jgi:hypothetical protein
LSRDQRRDLQLRGGGDAGAELLDALRELRLAQGVVEQQPEPAGDSAAASSRPSMLASVNPPTRSSTWASSRAHMRSRTAWYRSVLESKCR